jgi:hypothetical protein
VVSTSSDDCNVTLIENECEVNYYFWFTEPQQIESSNDLMLVYNDSYASSNTSFSDYVPPSEYTVLSLFTNDCNPEVDTNAAFYLLLTGDPYKDNVTEAGKTYDVASAKSETIEVFRTASCEYDVSASLALTTVALSFCFAALLVLL